jgi:hypothetical protein
MTMTDTPESAPALAGEPGFPDAASGGGGGGDGIDVLSLGRMRPAAAAWLLVTAADGLAGETFTASVAPGPRPRAHGGDVLLRIAPGAEAASVSVSVWAVAAGTLVPVADWDLPDDGAWAEGVRPAAFAMSALAALEEHADLGSSDAVGLDDEADGAVAGLPWPLPGRGLAVAAG